MNFKNNNLNKFPKTIKVFEENFYKKFSGCLIHGGIFA